MDYFAVALEQAICEETEPDFESAVGIVQDRDKWLLGLARKTADDRTGKWCMPGGHIKRNETPKKAAEREVKEESGIRCRTSGAVIRDQKYKGVAFVPCKVTSSGQTPDPNHEFSAMGFFTITEMRSLKLYRNVKDLISRAKKQR